MTRNLESYLASTRRLRGDFTAEKYYKSLHDNICNAMGAYAPLPRIHVTYSTERTCETLEVAGEHFVIYDQYLGQTFNQINRLHLNGSEPGEMTTYGCKLLAERMQLLGHLEQSLSLSLAYRQRKDNSKNTFMRERNLKQRVTWTMIQESYIIVHELLHFVLNRDRAWRAAAISDARRDFYTNLLLPLARNSQSGEAKLSTLNSIAQEVALFLRSDALVEECVCDTLAVPIIWQMYRRQCNAATVRSAISFSLRSLHLLAIINAYGDIIQNVDSKFEADSRYLVPFLVRNRFLQWNLGQLEPFSKIVNESSHDYKFSEQRARYERLVYEPIEKDLLDFTQRMKTIEFARPDYRNANRMNLQIDELIGNIGINSIFSEMDEKHFIKDIRKINLSSYEARKRIIHRAMRDRGLVLPESTTEGEIIDIDSL